MNKKIKSLVLAAVMGLSLTTVAVVPATVEAASAGAAETLIGGAVAYAYVSTAFNKMDNSKEGQEESLARAKKQTGYLEDSAAQARVQRIMKTLEASPSVKRSYVVYANPSDDFNAFATVGRVMSVNKGALDLCEHKDIVNGLKKQVGLSTAVSLAAGGGSNAAILSNIAGNYMENQVFTMGQEKAADELGFKILSESPYNVGGAAASMAVLRNKYGDLYREGLNQVFSPNNHPKTSSRVKDNIDRMYTYSGNHVTVDNGAVFVNGVNIYSPANSGRYTGEERAYFMAGKLARLYHNGQIQPGGASYDGPTVTVAGRSIVTTPNADVALMVATNLNNSFVKAAGPAKGKQAAKTNKKKASKK